METKTLGSLFDKDEFTPAWHPFSAYSHLLNNLRHLALIAGLKTALALGVKELDIIGDSLLVIRQTLKKCQTRDPKLKPYRELSIILLKQFCKVTHIFIPRTGNILADCLASLASSLSFPISKKSETVTIQRLETPATELRDCKTQNLLNQQSQTERITSTTKILALDLEDMDDGNPWYFDIKNYLEDGSFLEYATDSNQKIVKRIAIKYCLRGGILFRASFYGELHGCLDDEEAYTVVEEAHSKVYGGHVNAQMLAKKVLRMGYYWPTLEGDCNKYVLHYVQCQTHANKIHAPAFSLHPMTSPWPFSMWALDKVGPFRDTVENTTQKAFILTATKYFTKWVKAESYVLIKSPTLAHFVCTHILARFGTPIMIITDNGHQFISQEFQDLCDKHHIELHHSTPYYPQGNGQAEATNKRQPHPKGKLQPTWEGPYVITHAYSGNAYRLVDTEGVEVSGSWNALYLKKFHA
ncbi:hypothetical protein QJS04_geneDACA012714 [Acorus gramineus]|uniref:Integrase catalytic domain-containing protein n=1 Tax=Acorus gramineus TaxID=55184 RepID=A0AAV9A1Z2_ACOGR|nr:hypothetical protein QJS04_geneDACA012714 [Acorus gramineus]